VHVERLEKIRAALVRVRLLQDLQQRMIVELRRAFIKKPGNRRRRLRHHPDRAIDDRVLHEASARERLSVHTGRPAVWSAMIAPAFEALSSGAAAPLPAARKRAGCCLNHRSI